MLATLAPLPPDGRNWSFEYKWDGVRALARWDGKSLRLLTRNLLDATDRYPELHALGPALGKTPAILDGEIVSLDDLDRPSFTRLQRRMHVRHPKPALVREFPALYVVFDLLHLDGRSLIDLPLVERRRLLEELTVAGPSWRVSPAHVGAGKEMLETARQHGLEGLVAKRLDSNYEPGKRSPAWRKIKLVHRQEFVVGGWSPQVGAPDTLGALHIGYYELPPGQGSCRPSDKLQYAGAVGTGFDQSWRRKLMPMLRELATDRNPFSQPPPKRGKWASIRQRDLNRAVHYVRPRLVIEVEFRRWPVQGMVQQAAFKGLRTDKQPGTVVKEFRLAATDEAGNQDG